ncbi:aldehyde dehydrogenase iron-sulfur subunit PaoA [Acidovorax sp. LjRoot194]|uniref:aldehyde dehydrogenase iron-sulfur subunit PaoA n=1 Tax=Acidovorax sp. LjRoot194 TaxID=3342280 RepID=UPI003ECF2F56
MDHHSQLHVTRRGLLIAGASTAAASTVYGQTDTLNPSAQPMQATNMPITLQVNGRDHLLDLDTRTTLLDTLREHLHLTGTKKGCDHGQCGACTVLVNGRRVVSCLSLAVMNEGASVTTIEGLGTPQSPHPMQVAFVRHDGYQCGYCTPGQICSAVGVLDEIKQGMPSHASQDIVAQPLVSAAELRERMSGNLCRCGAYSNIVDAITEVSGRART